MGNQTVVIHCDQCGVSSPRGVSELDQSTELQCHVCGGTFSEEAIARARQGSKVIIVRGKRS
jgi:uncharacterized Zn finger protein